MIIGDQRSWKYKIKNWWSNFWNQFDFVMYLLVIVSVILRFELFTDFHFVYVRIVYSITLVMTYLRFMQFFFAEKNMGPKVIMIRKMVSYWTIKESIFLFFFTALVLYYKVTKSKITLSGLGLGLEQVMLKSSVSMAGG